LVSAPLTMEDTPLSAMSHKVEVAIRLVRRDMKKLLGWMD
jgi:hypothetical protein